MKSTSGYKVKITVGDATVEVEGGEAGVVKIVEAVADVIRGQRKTVPATYIEGISPPASIQTPGRSGPVDIRSFFQEKAPSSDVEATAVVAYYYKYAASQTERRETINAAQLQEAFRLAKWPLPSATKFTLQNARNAGYLDATGESGNYRINAVGYNLVEHTLGGPGAEPGSKQKAKGKNSRPKRHK